MWQLPLIVIAAGLALDALFRLLFGLNGGLVLLIAAGTIGVGSMMFFRRKPAPPPVPAIRDMTLASLAPADVININGSMLIVENVLECSEDMGVRITHWRWSLLEGGQLLEVETGSQILYEAPALARQGSEMFEQLVADDGVLKTFEARVREH